MLSPWHDVREDTSQTLIILNNVSSNVARSKMTDVVTSARINNCSILAEEQYGFRTNSATEKTTYMLTRF